MELILGLFGLLLFLAGVAGILWAIFGKQYRRVAGIGGALSLVLWISLASIKVVGAGEIGIVKHFGSVELQERGPGINIVVPFLTDIVNVNGRVQGINFENLGAASREYQDVFLTGTLNIHVQFDRAAELYQTVGLDYQDKVVTPFYSNIVKEIVPQFGVAQVLPQREQIRKLTVEKLRVKLEPYGIVVDDVALSQIDFNEDYNQAIQNKQIQELQVQTEKNILEQKKIVAEQAVIAAQGEAKSNVERAKGEAQATIERAKGDAEAAIQRGRGQAEANRLLGESLTTEVLQWEAINKINPNVQFGLVPSDSGFLLDPRGLFRPAQ